MALVIKLGCDPEYAVRDKKTGLFVSAHTLLPGTKDQPHKVDLGAVQVDGVAAEFNIDPVLSASGFLGNISVVTSALQGFIGEGYELVSEPVAEFSHEYFKSLPDHVRELGCNPDWDAWTGQVNEKPDSDVLFRTFSGHIHVGWTDKADIRDTTHFEDCRIVAKQLDYYLGMMSLKWDEDTKRRSLYGKAGAFRPKPYGMEYRPLSNVWLRTPKLQQWVYNATHKAVTDLIVQGSCVEDTLGDSARDIINNSVRWWDKDYAKTKADKKVQSLFSLTGLSEPPPLPKPVVKVEGQADTSVPIKRVRKRASHSYLSTDSKQKTLEVMHQVMNEMAIPSAWHEAAQNLVTLGAGTINTTNNVPVVITDDLDNIPI